LAIEEKTIPQPTGSAEAAGTSAGAGTPRGSRLPGWLDPLVLVIAAALVLLPRLGDYGLHDPWETHYGEVARNMLESGDWISPWWGSYWPEGPPCAKDADCPADNVCRNIRAEYLPHQATCRPKDVNREGEYFFSKPVLSMWLMALGMAVAGVNEWGVRLPFTLLSLLALLAVWAMTRRLFGRREALVAALLLLATPLYFLISRQAVTDGPFVTLMTIGICLFLLARFGPDEPPPRWLRWAFIVVLGLLVIPQALLLATSLRVYIRTSGFKILVGAFHGGAYLILLGLLIRWAYRSQSTRQLLLWAFYAAIGLASLAKGLLGVALPGAIILLHLIVTWDFKQLRRLEIPRGSLVFAVVAFPWYGAMFARHLTAFFDRFFIHDHFKRLAQGVHHLDEGGFEYVTRWLGLGTFPWLGFLPAALIWAAAGVAGRRLLAPPSGTTPPSADEPSTRRAVKLFLLLWVLVPATLFALSSTKFHHYVFPIVPPAMLLVGLFLHRLAGLERRGALLLAAVLLVALGINGLLASDLALEPRRLVNLFTYKYDREWPGELDYAPFLTLLGLAASLPLLWWLGREVSRPLGLVLAGLLGGVAALLPPNLLPLLELLEETLACSPEARRGGARGAAGLIVCVRAAVPCLRRSDRPGRLTPLTIGVIPLLLLALGFGIWSQVEYMYQLSNRWSQAAIFGAYRAACTRQQPIELDMAGYPRCTEDVAAYKMNWRGETFYSRNKVLPLLSDTESRYFLRSEAGKRRFFLIVERSRLQSQLRPLFTADRWKKVRPVCQGNTKFLLLEIPPAS